MANLDEKATAGLRGAYWDPARLPADARLTVHPLRTQDGQVVAGYLLSRGGEKVCAVFTHPREHMVAHYLAAELLDQGIAMFMLAPRLVGNDIRLEHEIAIYDLASGMQFLRGLGFARLVALGNSGGGPLWALYNQQALCAPAARIERTPAGRPTKLASAELIPPDAIVFVSAHLGQGKLLMNCIDASLTDEADAFSVDPTLDPFSAANGFTPEGATYAPDFIVSYRAAQEQRVARIDEAARQIVQRRAQARKSAATGGGALDRAIAAHTPIFPVWRTDADLRCWDTSIDPSARARGSLWGADPFASNYGSVGFGRICTAESWLSTWSGLSSNASMQACAPAIEQPTLMIEYAGDQSTFPADNDLLFGWIGSSSKTRQLFAGDHHGKPVSKGDTNLRPDVGACIGSWIRQNIE